MTTPARSDSACAAAANRDGAFRPPFGGFDRARVPAARDRSRVGCRPPRSRARQGRTRAAPRAHRRPASAVQPISQCTRATSGWSPTASRERERLVIERERARMIALGEGHLRQEAERHAAALMVVQALVDPARLLDERHARVQIAGREEQHPLHRHRERVNEVEDATRAARDRRRRAPHGLPPFDRGSGCSSRRPSALRLRASASPTASPSAKPPVHSSSERSHSPVTVEIIPAASRARARPRLGGRIGRQREQRVQPDRAR